MPSWCDCRIEAWLPVLLTIRPCLAVLLSACQAEREKALRSAGIKPSTRPEQVAGIVDLLRRYGASGLKALGTVQSRGDRELLPGHPRVPLPALDAIMKREAPAARLEQILNGDLAPKETKEFLDYFRDAVITCTDGVFGARAPCHCHRRMSSLPA